MNNLILSIKSGGWGVTCRVKIDPLDLGKTYTKYIWGACPLQMESNAPKFAFKINNFQHFTSWNTKGTGHELDKMEVCVLANFSKTAERNKTPFTGIQVRLKLSSNQQTDQKLVHSTRRYCNIKVPYQMPKSPKYWSGFAKIHHVCSEHHATNLYGETLH